jgi:hypothetical protein
MASGPCSIRAGFRHATCVTGPVRGSHLEHIVLNGDHDGCHGVRCSAPNSRQNFVTVIAVPHLQTNMQVQKHVMLYERQMPLDGNATS